MKIIYRANDGREFDIEKDALYHDETLQMLGDVLERLRASDNTEQEIYKLLNVDGINVPKKESETPKEESETKKEPMLMGENPNYNSNHLGTSNWVIIVHRINSHGKKSIIDYNESNSYDFMYEIYDVHSEEWVYRDNYISVDNYLYGYMTIPRQIFTRVVKYELLKKLNKEYYGY